MDTFNKLFDDIFGSFGPFFDSKKANYDWNKLSQTGKVTEEIKEVNGYKTITKSYTSNDGIVKITTTSSEPIIDHEAKQLDSITRQLKSAIDAEDFELATKLRDQKRELLNKRKK